MSRTAKFYYYYYYYYYYKRMIRMEVIERTVKVRMLAWHFL